MGRIAATATAESGRQGSDHGSDHGQAWNKRRQDELAWRFHEEWLGYVQPREGLVFSVPVLAEAECHERHSPLLQEKLRLICRDAEAGKTPTKKPIDGKTQSKADDKTGYIADPTRVRVDLDALLTAVLDYDVKDFDQGAALPADLHLYVPEGEEDLRPSMALRRRTVRTEIPATGLIPDATTPASRAGEGYLMLVRQLPDGVAFDKPGVETGVWAYPPAAKFDRLLRACQVPIGLLANGEAVRLIYAPHGAASGSVTFRIGDMTRPGTEARHLLDAFRNLLGAPRFFAVSPDRQLPALLQSSRSRQADVTKALAGQVLDAIGLLVGGVERASERHGGAWLDEILARGHAEGGTSNELYEGLLTVLLRLVFCLYAEDKGLLPVENKTYETYYSVHALFEQLREDDATHPDTMDRRYGAWARLLALFRAIHQGVAHGELAIPARHGEVFDPRRFPFLEDAGGHVPAIDDETVFGVLRELIMLGAQRLSYRALDVEQLGSVYEGLMGFRVERLGGAAVCLRGNRVWVTAKEVISRKGNERVAYLEDDVGVERSVLKRIGAEVKSAANEAEMVAALSLAQAGRIGHRTKGQLVVQPGLERRRTSSHYTPRELTERVVSRALEPLLGAMGGAPSSERLLNLKICDPAMGSGAFLVAACRFLAEQVVAAWTREEKQAELGSAREDALLRAKRLVAQRCLYGVDKNPLAVNLAKLSLWLETMARGEPFTFVDHALRHGDSLVGLTIDQIRAFDWNIESRKLLELPFGAEIDEYMGEALHRRQRILALAHRLGTDPAEKEALLLDAEDALYRPRLIGDLLIGAWFSADKDNAREKERVRRRDLVLTWVRDGGDPSDELRIPVEVLRTRVKPFHWMLEFPEIFYAERADPLANDQRNQVAWIDSIVSNPPFMGGRLISGTLGMDYAQWLEFHHDASLNADLVAHFFRRAAMLIGDHGTVGMVATKTIAQGDSRATGLQRIVSDGASIYDAIHSMPWPGEAAVSVALVHFAKGTLRSLSGMRRLLDGRVVAQINSRLLGAAERSDPLPLKANKGLCYQGSIVLGMGFVLTPEERKDLLRKNPANGKLIFPYLGGEEVNTSPTQEFDRYVINFGNMSLAEAERWPDLLHIVREKVKPERDRVNRDAHRKYWWHYADKRPALNAALAKMRQCLVCSIVSSHLCFSFQPTNRVFSHRLEVFTIADHARFGVLQSRVHEKWARLLSSTLETRLNYAASDCLDTFPLPEPKFLIDSGKLAVIGKRLYESRAQLMIEREQGLTVTYNQLKDPSNQDRAIVALRHLHEAMDRAVLDAYGWSDIVVPPFETPNTPQDKAAFEHFSDTVIDHLFALNAERAAAEKVGSPPTSSAQELPRRIGPKRVPRVEATTSAQQARAKRKKAS